MEGGADESVVGVDGQGGTESVSKRRGGPSDSSLLSPSCPSADEETCEPCRVTSPDQGRVPCNGHCYAEPVIGYFSSRRELGLLRPSRPVPCKNIRGSRIRTQV